MNIQFSAALSPHKARNIRILILSRHDYRTARRASVHFLAQKLAERGHDVAFLSIGYSWLSRMRGDSRKVLDERANRWEEIDGLRAYLWRTPWHPIRMPVPDALTGWLFERWADMPCPELDAAAADAELILIESGIAPALIRRVRAAAPHARIVYRATDLLATAGVPDCIEATLRQQAQDIDLVVVVARSMLPHFDGFDCPRIFIPHGVDVQKLQRQTDSPYSSDRNAVAVGSMLFDDGAIRTLAQAMPHFTFHMIGTPKRAFPANVITYDEMPFDQTLPYLHHADVGIAAYLPAEASAYLADSSLKLMQYNAIGLPAVCPHFAVGDHALRFGYRPGHADELVAAFTQATQSRRNPGPTQDWSDIAGRLVEVAFG